MYFCCRGLYSLVDWNVFHLSCVCIHPGRGLYSLVDWNTYKIGGYTGAYVEAYTASWIEIALWLRSKEFQFVEAYTASWIEMAPQIFKPSGRLSRGLYSLVDWNKAVWDDKSVVDTSRLIQPRGLKYGVIRSHVWMDSRGLYSLVDWNVQQREEAMHRMEVEAYTASWIEMIYGEKHLDMG